MATYIGVAPPEQTGIIERYRYTGDGSTTVFSGNDVNGKQLRYTSTNPLLVFLNGVQLIEDIDFTKTSNTQVTFTTAPASNDDIEMMTFGSYDLQSPSTLRENMGLELSNGEIFVGSSSDVTSKVTPSGDATISNTGAITVASAAGDFNVTDALTFSGNGSASAPIISLGATNTGIYRNPSGNYINFTHNSSNTWVLGNTIFQYQVHAAGPALRGEVASSTNPTVTPYRGDGDTGIGADGSDGLYLITGGNTGLTVDSSQNVTITNDLTVDTNTLHVDSTNNRVGIGTTSPTTLLHLSSTSPKITITDTDGTGSQSIFADNDNLYLDAKGALILDGGSQIMFSDDNTNYGAFVYAAGSNKWTIHSQISDVDFVINGNDGGTQFDALSFDMSEAGAATFNDKVTLGASKHLVFGDPGEYIYGDGTNLQIVSSNALGIDTVNGIVLDSGSGGTTLKAGGGTIYGCLVNSSGDLIIKSGTTTALTFSGADVTAANDLTVTGDLTVSGSITTTGVDLGDNEYIRLGASQDLQLYHDASNSYIKDAGTGDLRIEGSFVRLVDTSNGGTTATFASNGVNLRYSNNVKLTTTNAGATITGSLNVAGTPLAIGNDNIQVDFSAPEGRIQSKNSTVSPASNLGLYTTDTGGTTNKVVHINYQQRVGINTTSPSAALHVVPPSGTTGLVVNANDSYFGNVSSGDYVDVGNLGDVGNVYLDARGTSSNVNIQLRAKGSDGRIIFSKSNGGTTLGGFDSDGDFYIDTDTLYVDAVNDRVGIGTTSPSAPLEVISNGAQEGIFLITTCSTSQPAIIIKDTTNSRQGGFRLAGGSNQLLQIGGGYAGTSIDTISLGADIMSGAACARLDIGTTSACFQNGDVNICCNLTIGGNLTVNGTTTTINTATLDVEDLNITIACGAANATAANGAGITVDGAAACLTYRSGCDAWSFNKKLGIGTDNPSHMLHIASTGDAGILIQADSDNVDETHNPYINMAQDGFTGSLFTIGIEGNAGQQMTDSLANAPFIHATNVDSQPLQLAHNGAVVMTVRCPNVGIGITNPATKLHVENGEITISDGTTCHQIGSSVCNLYFGLNALNCITTGTHNIAIGASALASNTTGVENVAIGTVALTNNVCGVSNTAIGFCSLYCNTGNSNTAVGSVALGFNTTGSNNTALGNAALRNNTTGTQNSAVGMNSLTNNTGGVQNTAMGYAANQQTTTGSYNTSLGHSAMIANTTGNFNVAIGRFSMYANTIGSSNVAIGQQALSKNTTASFNVAIGEYALACNTTAQFNTAIGHSALCANTIGQQNTAVGRLSLNANTTGDANTAVGQLSLTSNTIGCGNVGIGFDSLRRATEANENVAVGKIALGFTTTGNQNTALGTCAMYTNTTGASNVALGKQALFSNTIGNNNVALGTSALLSNTTADGNVAVGRSALESNTIGSFNTALGCLAMCANTTGEHNTAIGHGALKINTIGPRNVALGALALECSSSSVGQNTAIGYASLRNDEAGSNTAVGHNSLANNTTGCENTSIGTGTMFDNTTGSQNTTVGFGSLSNNTIGSANSVLGMYAMLSNTTGNNNIAVGRSALRLNTIGANNTALGESSLFSNTTGNFNTAVGQNSLVFNTTGSCNTGIGYRALYCNTIATENTAVGFCSMELNVTGSYNSAFGFRSLRANTTGTQNTALGRYSLFCNVTGIHNTGVGDNALTYNSSGICNTAIGSAALRCNQASNNVAVGASALTLNTTASGNVAVGTYAMCSNVTGGGNTAVGHNSLQCNLDNGNTAIGFESMKTNTTGSYNTAVGRYSLFSNTTGVSNTAFGNASLWCNTTGSCNTGYGTNSLMFNTTGGCNTAVGYHALNCNTIGSQNVAVGVESGKCNTTGQLNVFLGYRAGFLSTTGSRHVFIGRCAGATTDGTNGLLAIGTNALANNTTGNWNIAIGDYALVSNTTGINNVAIGFSAACSTTIGINNVAIGCRSLTCNTTGSNNTAVGTNSLLCSITGINNVAVGSTALASNTIGISNIAVGYCSLRCNTIGDDNIAIGCGASALSVNASRNTAIGTQALYCNSFASETSGYNNAIGFNAMRNNASGQFNEAVGSFVLCSLTTGSANVIMGYASGNNVTSGSRNVAIGSNALQVVTTESDNVAIGTQALRCNAANYNTVVGSYAGYYNSTGSCNVAMGACALCSNTTGFANTAVGYNAGCDITTGSNNTVIGYKAQASSATATNEITLGDTNVTTLRTAADITAFNTKQQDIGSSTLEWDKVYTQHLVGTSCNLYTYSQQFDDSSWQKGRSCITATNIVAPDGTTTAEELTQETGNTTYGYIQKAQSVTSGCTYTMSIYAKQGTWSFIQLRQAGLSAAQSVFDLSNGTICCAGIGHTPRIESVGNGWYRISTTATMANTGCYSNPYYLSDTVLSTVSASGGSIYIWGAQLNEGSLPTEYVPTTTTAADSNVVHTYSDLKLDKIKLSGNTISLPNTNCDLEFSASLLPTTTNCYSLGASGCVWANIYSGDLHLNNMAQPQGNAVDGTKGNWTLQEGQNDLFLINNNTGKKYRFKIEEIE